jgi:hypothetical protein
MNEAKDTKIDVRTIDGVEYKVGDRVKFTDYDHHPTEYAIRKGQSVTISHLYIGSNNVGIKWDDGRSSHAWYSSNFWGMHHSDDGRINEVFHKLKQSALKEAIQ